MQQNKKIKQIKIIPPNPKYDRTLRVEQKTQKVAAYCRVSIRYEQQENSFEAQVNYFTEKIISNPLWNFAGIYSDQGKTATNTKTRESFNDMIEDCYAGKIDLILTKSISRFARNTVDFLRIIRELKELNIAIIFEKENINTLDSSGELFITILGSQAQEESRNLSENTRWGITRTFEQGIVRVNHNKLLGYTKDADGKLIIVPEEAAIIKKIFDLYTSGLGTYRIARILEQEGIPTVTGNQKWNSGVISTMLKSEKYIGDAMLQKTYTIDFISKKRVKNDGYVKRYYIENNHEGIITKQQYYLVQEELKKRNNKMASETRYSSKYPLSGLLICAGCGSRYTRVTWYREGGNQKIYVWRCAERIRTGIQNCKASPSLNEENLYYQVLNQIQQIADAEIETLSALQLQTKALIMKYIVENKNCEISMTKGMWDSIIEEVSVKSRDRVDVVFKTGMTQEIHLY